MPELKRRAQVARTSEFKLLNEQMRGFLFIGLAEMEVPADDEDDNNSPARVSPMMSRGRRRRGAGSKNASNPVSMIPTAQEAILPITGSTALRLASLLIHKQLNKDEWEDDWNKVETDLRNECLEKGVHPAWIALGEKTPLLAQFAAFPKAKASKKAKAAKVDLSKAWISGDDSEKLLDFINTVEESIEDPKSRVSLAALKGQLKDGRRLTPDESLLNLSGDLSSLSAILAIQTESDNLDDILKELSKTDDKLASKFELLNMIKSGQDYDFITAISSDESDELTTKILQLAWLNPSEKASTLESSKLIQGLELISSLDVSAEVIEKLNWWKLTALCNEDKKSEALEALNEINLESSESLGELLPLLNQLGSDAYGWLELQLPRISNVGLRILLNEESLGFELKAESARLIQDSEQGLDLNDATISLPIFMRTMNLRRSARILTEYSDLVNSHPWETILVSHLIAAGRENDLFISMTNSRRIALSSVFEVDPPEYFSDLSTNLIRLLEGVDVEDGVFIEVLDKVGAMAFKPIRQSLKAGASNLTKFEEMDKLLASVEKAKENDSIDQIAYHLFCEVIDTLRLSRFNLILQNGDMDETNLNAINDMLTRENIPTRMIHTTRHLVLEHDIGLPALVSWYQNNDPLSPWHTLARAALAASQNDELNAARDYRRAGDHKLFDYEHSMVLYRKSLIHLAFAEQWKEAVELLENHPSLKTAITKRFQLYINVSFIASQKKTEEATKMVKNHVRKVERYVEENEEGELINKTRTTFSEEDLDLLKTYADEHPRPLPEQPFKGRVMAALSSVTNSRRRKTRASNEQTFNQIMSTIYSGTAEDLFEFAKDVCEEKPVDGLNFIERAIRTSNFRPSEMKRIIDAEKTLFARYKEDIPTRSRRYLKNLALNPLIIVDTNVLVDALFDLINDKLSIAREVSLDFDGRGQFHKVLKYRAEEGRVFLWLPDIVKKEMRGFVNNIENIMKKFDDVMVDPELLNDIMQEDSINQMVESIFKDYNNWNPDDLRLEEESDNSEAREFVDDFLIQHKDIYEQLTEMKRIRDTPLRTKLDGDDIYPELGDKSLMKICSNLAQRPLKEVGSILIATRDGDFTMVARACEENFGFGVIKDSRTLNDWVKN